MKRMHPAYVLTQLPRFVWLLLLPLLRWLPAWGVGAPMRKLPVLAAAFLIFAAAYLRWRARKWLLQGDTLVFRSGIFLCRQYRIPFAAVAAVRESRGPLLTLFGARRLRFETVAGKGRAVTLLLSRREAQLCLAAYAGEALAPVFQLRARDTLVASLSTSNFALGLFAAAPILRAAGNLFGSLVQERLRDVLTSAQRLAASYIPPVLTAIALLALLGWALHVLKLAELYHRFTLRRSEKALATQSGLLIHRRVYLRTAGLSALAIRQTMLLAFIRRSQLCALYAGRTGGRGEETFLLPLCLPDQAQALVKELWAQPEAISLRMPRAQRRRAYFPAFGQICALAGAAAFAVFFTNTPLRTAFFTSAAALPILILFFFPARKRERREGAGAGFRMIRAVRGFSEWTLFFRPGALYGIRAAQTPGQAKSGLCTVRTAFRTTRQERFLLRHLPAGSALRSYKNELDKQHIQHRSNADA